MSYILDALRRSDQERRQQRGRAPVAGDMRPHPRHGRGLLLAALAALLLLNAAILATWALRQAPGTTAAAGAGDNPAQRVVEQKPPAQAPEESLLARAADEGEARWLEPWQMGQPEQPDQPKDAAERDAQPPAAAQAPAKPAANAEPAAPAPSEPAEPLPMDAPLLAQLPQAMRERLGTVEIGVHVYAQAPSDRFLIFNGRRLREGKTLDSGLKLVAITADGAIFRFEDQPFRVVLR